MSDRVAHPQPLDGAQLMGIETAAQPGADVVGHLRVYTRAAKAGYDGRTV
jgi:hypothetical protein